MWVGRSIGPAEKTEEKIGTVIDAPDIGGLSLFVEVVEIGRAVRIVKSLLVEGLQLQGLFGTHFLEIAAVQ